MQVINSQCFTTVKTEIGNFEYYKRIIRPDGSIVWEYWYKTRWIETSSSSLIEKLEKSYQEIDNN